jgi:CheY-like chemotaxis protein
VFLDVMMPAMNGFDVCNQVKNILGMNDVFIVMLTAKGQELDRKRSINRIFFPATSGAIFGPSIRTKEQHCGRVDEGTSLASTDQVLLAAASDRLEGKPAESV